MLMGRVSASVLLFGDGAELVNDYYMGLLFINVFGEMGNCISVCVCG